MNIKSLKYMVSKEFEERQKSFEFFCAEAFKFVIEFKKECLKGWAEIFKKPVTKQKQFSLNLTRKLKGKFIGALI